MPELGSFRDYYLLTKPGIIRGNAITAIAGFLLASQRHLNFGLLIAMLAGLSGIIGSACAFNNYIDRDIDKKMARTKKRALPRGTIGGPEALIFASILGALGSLLLIRFVNVLTFLVALTGFIVYVIFYGIAKRASVHGTIIGSIAGAVPPVVGYTAATNHLDTAAWLLFLILVFWQMPHFYAIALYRQRDYSAAGLPVLPVVKGQQATRNQILVYIGLFTAAALLLNVTKYASYTYTGIVLLLGGVWFKKGLTKTADNAVWGKKMFLFSLVVISVWSITIMANALLP